jgi:SAM-dependent methyltransferase
MRKGLGHGLWKRWRPHKMGQGTSQRLFWCWCVDMPYPSLFIAQRLIPDIAANSIDDARLRWEASRRFDANFAVLDCYSESLSKAFSPAKLAQPFDVVSMQFCMHYAFESLHKARCMLDNVSRWLRPGGVFIGTIPNADQLLYVVFALRIFNPLTNSF